MLVSQSPGTLEAVYDPETWRRATEAGGQPARDPDRDRFDGLARGVSAHRPSARRMDAGQMFGLLGLAVQVFEGTQGLSAGAGERLADLWRLVDLIRARPGFHGGTVTVRDLAQVHQDLFGFPDEARNADPIAALRLVELMGETRRRLAADRSRATQDPQVSWDDLRADPRTLDALTPLPLPVPRRHGGRVFPNLVTFELEENVRAGQAGYERYRADHTLVIFDVSERGLPGPEQMTRLARDLGLRGPVRLLLRGVDESTRLGRLGLWPAAFAAAFGAPVPVAVAGDVRPDGVREAVLLEDAPVYRDWFDGLARGCQRAPAVRPPPGRGRAVRLAGAGRTGLRRGCPAVAW